MSNKLETQILPDQRPWFAGVAGNSPVMGDVLRTLEEAAPTDRRVLLQGEPGTGKRLLARAIHQTSARAMAPFVVLDCALSPPDRVEVELFGIDLPAPQFGQGDQPGALEAVGAGTLFLSAIDDLALGVQERLLDAFIQGQFCRAGSSRAVLFQARVIASCHRALDVEVRRGKFLAGLREWLRDTAVEVPPLRERREDIPALVQEYVRRAERATSSQIPVMVSPAALGALSAHDWPGNVRELFGVLERALHLDGRDDGPLDAASVSVGIPAERIDVGLFSAARSYRETRTVFECDFERRYVSWLLERHRGNISAAAREAQMDRKHLYDLAKKHNLRHRHSSRPPSVR